MKQVWTSALFLVCVGAAVAYANDTTVTSDESAAPSSREARHAAFRLAFGECLAENNLTPPQPGSPPSEADRATMETCLKSKGFNHPPGPPPRERGVASEAE